MSKATNEILEVLSAAKSLARRYRALTGKPLGVNGEVAEFEASRNLGLELTEARAAGYDAIRTEKGAAIRLQVKGRCILPGSKPGQRYGRVRLCASFGFPTQPWKHI